MGSSVLKLKSKWESCKLEKKIGHFQQIWPFLPCSESDVKYKTWSEGSKDATLEKHPTAVNSGKKCGIVNKLCKTEKNCARIYIKILIW